MADPSDDTFEQLYDLCAEDLGPSPVVVLRHGTGSYFAFVSEYVGAPVHKGSSPHGFLPALAKATQKVGEKSIPEATRRAWTQEPFQMMGFTAVDVTKVRAVERGEYDQDRHDWRAVLVLAGGDRIAIELFVQEALVVLNKKGLA